MPVERCEDCGFNDGDWTDAAALEVIAELSMRWEDRDRRNRTI